MKSLKYYFTKANKHNWALPQFNFSDFVQLKAIIESAFKNHSPVILGTSESESNFFGLEEAVALRDILRKKVKIPIFLNLDHGKNIENIQKAINVGYDMIHFDGSNLSLEENIRITKNIIKYAKRRGTLVEGEVGRVGKEASIIYQGKFVIKEADLTKPEEALEFVKKTGVDLLAISIGNFHGMSQDNICPNLKLDLLKEVKRNVEEKTFLVLHGGSGIPESDIKQAVKLGIDKVNINTELRVVYCESMKEVFEQSPQEIRPYKLLPFVQSQIEKVVSKKITLLKSYNRI